MEKMHEALRKRIEDNGFEVAYKNIDEVEDNEKFVEIRSLGFGASESSVLLGVNPFKKLDELLDDKVYLTQYPEIQEKPAVKMGNDLEPLIIEKLNNAFEQSTKMSNFIKPRDMYRDNSTGLAVNFDGVVEYNGDLVPAEVKTISFFGSRYYNFNMAADIVNFPDYIDIIDPGNAYPANYEEMDFKEALEENASMCGIPPYYYTQLQQQMYFLNSDVGFLIALNTKSWTYYMFKINRDQPMIDKLKETAQENFIELHRRRFNETSAEEDEEDIV